MKVKLMIMIFGIGLMMPMPLSAFECPKLFAIALKSITDTENKLNKMKMMIPKDSKVGINDLLEEAKELLGEGKTLHEEADSKLNHAQSIAKIRSAYGYSLAAGTLITKLMKM